MSLSLATHNRYDQASRYLAKQHPQPLVNWLIGNSVLINTWLDTQSIPFPDQVDRRCDTVAQLHEPAVSSALWAVPIEFQSEPDFDMNARLMVYLGRLRQEIRPGGRGRRYEVGAAVVNLTGVGDSSLSGTLGGRLETALKVCEKNLSQESAAETVQGVSEGRLPQVLLPWVPLMQGGGESEVIASWLVVAGGEVDRKQRGDWGGLARVYADLTEASEPWHEALEGWNMIESPTVAAWIEQGRVEGARNALRTVLETRFGPLPEALRQQLNAAADEARLEAALGQAIKITQLNEFCL